MDAASRPSEWSHEAPDNIARARILGPHLVATYKPGREIYGQGDTVAKCYQIETGTVRVYRLLSDGRRQIVAFCFAGEVFGLEAGSTHRFFAEAVTETTLAAFRQTTVQEHSRELLELALDGMARAQEHLLVVRRQCAVERMAAFLLDLSNRLGALQQLRLPMSRQDIADYLGLTIETVSRVIAKLKERSIIALRDSRAIDIMKPGTLRSLCN
ncbi:helix-turn-helix domain-containing protein [Sinorhizobium prairiense]|uniref:helix-turn-helix domain-containing protein n=1 Tax=unclassified Sinorhizobium TaxID=2613772 RepID=UPI0023D8965A|nr:MULTISPECIES: helix-turn-helix domain-containing protein [unclassified Sinorhizobium]WEJ08672.1 helix-turn-helix domain-containing protein [Sinorhizobium sp. M103]WEJ13826.1 helix-turn-helix domain-containing protein [Sinorhizobium sp. K101]WEJ35425.1 helix-turn-helix domain-containing protein [Sinorhizobium sp. C101]